MLSVGDVATAAAQLGMYMVTVVLALAIHLYFTLSLLYFAFTRKNPLVFFKGMLQAWITALATSSRSVGSRTLDQPPTFMKLSTFRPLYVGPVPLAGHTGSDEYMCIKSLHALKQHGPFVAFNFYCKIMLYGINYT